METTKIFNSEECLICYHNFDDQKAYELSCGHYYYHKTCLEKCHRAICPMCEAPHILKVTGNVLSKNQIIHNRNLHQQTMYNRYPDVRPMVMCNQPPKYTPISTT